MVFGYLKNSQQYEEKLKKPYREPLFSYKDIYGAVPKHLREKSLAISLTYVFRDWAMFVGFIYLATWINPLGQFLAEACNKPWLETAITYILWPLYHWHQGLVLTGTWILGHEAAHGNLSSAEWINDLLGHLLMTPVLCPFFAFKFSHNIHHKAVASVEREENFAPKTRSQFMEETPLSHMRLTNAFFEAFEDTPIFNLTMLAFHQLLGWPAYLIYNASGRLDHPIWGTSHLNPFAAFFKSSQNGPVASSTFTVFLTLYFYISLGYTYGGWNMWRYFWGPFLMMNHFMVWTIFLQHCDPTVPYFRKSDWTPLKGATSTVDRTLLGWQGKFFLHNFSHDHVVHHLLPDTPFYNGPAITELIKPIMGDDYNYDSTPAAWALWRNYIGCEYIDDEGGTVFYRNRYGEAIREHEASREKRLGLEE